MLVYDQGMKKMNSTQEPEKHPAPEIGEAMSQASNSTDDIFKYTPECTDWGNPPPITVLAAEHNKTLNEAIHEESLDSVKEGQKGYEEFEEYFTKTEKRNKEVANSTASDDKRLEKALDLYRNSKVEEGDAYLKKEFGFEVPTDWDSRKRLIQVYEAINTNGLAGMTAAMDIGDMKLWKTAYNAFYEIEGEELYAEKSVG
jgi:hypothetical protein